jgi:hypothetical protein
VLGTCSVRAELEQLEVDRPPVHLEAVKVVGDMQSVQIELEVVVKTLRLKLCAPGEALAGALT